MKIKRFVFLMYFILFNHVLYSQEWKNIKEYKTNTGNTVLQNGCWLKKDRIRNTDTWKQANQFNLSITNGNLKYKSVSEIRDFYLWFDQARVEKGHEINTFGILAIVAGQLSKFDSYFIRTFLVRNKEVTWFANEGSQQVFNYAFPLLKEVYNSKPIQGLDAKNWDFAYLRNEQCLILVPIYKKMSSKAIHKLVRIAKGKGLYSLGVNKQLKFKGDILNCESRYEHAILKLFPYYFSKN